MRANSVWICLQKDEFPMSIDKSTESTERDGYFKRVAHNDSTKKGLAAAVAGVIIGAVLEALTGA